MDYDFDITLNELACLVPMEPGLLYTDAHSTHWMRLGKPSCAFAEAEGGRALMRYIAPRETWPVR